MGESVTVMERIAIRGDGTASAVVGWLAVPVVVALTAGGYLSLAGGVLVGLVSAGWGTVSWLWNRRLYRRLLERAAALHADHDPGDSPVPWMSDAIWRRRNRFDPVVDAPTLLTSWIDRRIDGFGHDAHGAFEKPVLRPVTDAERELTRMGPVEGEAPSPGPADVLLAALGETPGRFVALGPRWPVCCRRLATLSGVRGEDDLPAATYLAAIEAQGDLEDEREGLHQFQCRACGRRYETDPVW